MNVIAPVIFVDCLAFAPIWRPDLDHIVIIGIGMTVLDFEFPPTLRNNQFYRSSIVP